MLTEGWDTNTVTHILGVRAFGTQLLCEQVVGRGLRRHPTSLAKPRPTATAVRRRIRRHPRHPLRLRDRAGEGRRRSRAEAGDPCPRGARARGAVDPLSARCRLPHRTAGRTARRATSPHELAARADAGAGRALPMVRLEGMVGEGHDISPDSARRRCAPTPSRCISRSGCCSATFATDGEPPPYHLFSQLQPITRRWIKDMPGAKGGTKAGMLTYAEIADQAAALIYGAICRANADGGPIVKAMLDPYNPAGSPTMCIHHHEDDLWRPTRAMPRQLRGLRFRLGGGVRRVVEAHPATLLREEPGARLRGAVARRRDSARYLPDFIVRIDDGHGPDDPLNLVVEIKGQKDIFDQIKAETMRALWAPGVNALKHVRSLGLHGAHRCVRDREGVWGACRRTANEAKQPEVSEGNALFRGTSLAQAALTFGVSWCSDVLAAADPARDAIGRPHSLLGPDYATRRSQARFLRVVTLEDAETVHNAFFDRGFREEDDLMKLHYYPETDSSLHRAEEHARNGSARDRIRARC